MFSKNNKLENFKDAETVIGPSIKVKGNFQGKGNIVIEGILEGSLKTAADVFIGKQAKISANIEANNIIINGEVKGNIKSKNYLAIGKTAKVFGDIQYGELSIERGGVANGQVMMISSENKEIENKKKEVKDNNEK